MAMDGKTSTVLEQADQLVRQYQSHINDWRELLKRTRTVARRIEERVQRVIEPPAESDKLSNRDAHQPSELTS